MLNTQLTNLTEIDKHIRAQIDAHPNRAQLAEAVGISPARLGSIAARLDRSRMRPDEFQKLADYFGLKITAEIVPVELDWIPHPANAVYEYEIDMTRRPTGKVRFIATKVIVVPVAAE